MSRLEHSLFFLNERNLETQVWNLFTELWAHFPLVLTQRKLVQSQLVSLPGHLTCDDIKLHCTVLLLTTSSSSMHFWEILATACAGQRLRTCAGGTISLLLLSCSGGDTVTEERSPEDTEADGRASENGITGQESNGRLTPGQWHGWSAPIPDSRRKHTELPWETWQLRAKWRRIRSTGERGQACLCGLGGT